MMRRRKLKVKLNNWSRVNKNRLIFMRKNNCQTSNKLIKVSMKLEMNNKIKWLKSNNNKKSNNKKKLLNSNKKKSTTVNNRTQSRLALTIKLQMGRKASTRITIENHHLQRVNRTDHLLKMINKMLLRTMKDKKSKWLMPKMLND